MGLFENRRVTYEEFSLGQGEHSIKIVHLSDLHFPKVSADAGDILAKVEALEADAVFVTGDLIRSSSDLAACGALGFAEKLASLQPVFFAEGNHEARHPLHEKIGEELSSRGVHVVTGTCVRALLGGGEFLIAGDSEQGGAGTFEGEGIRILLAHRPERAKEHARQLSPDYIFAGHAHGGQFRFFGHGLYAPGQGLFPKYTSGLYPIAEGTDMLVSRGIGKSRFPFRFNDPPHIPIVTLSF